MIEGFLNKLDDKIELPKEKKALYDRVMAKSIPDDFIINAYLDSEVIQKAVKVVESNPVYKDALKGVSENSFQYWDQIKKCLDDMEQTKKRAGKHHEASVIAKTRKKLVDEMDSIEPDYARARKLGQRTILRREIEEGFDKKDMTGRNFYNNVIRSKEKFSKLFNDLSEFPELQQQLLDMQTVFPKLFGTANAKAGVVGERTHVHTPRSATAWVGQKLEQLMNERGDIKSVEAITSPDWFANMKGKNVSTPGTSMSPEVQKFMRDYFMAQYGGDKSNE